MNCKEAIPWMHEYLDGDLTGPEAKELKEHLIACRACCAIFGQLERTEALVRSLAPVTVPDDLTAKIMSRIPNPRRRSAMFRWARRHPAMAVAAVFALVMFGSFLSLWNQTTDLVVKGADLDQLEIHGHTVIVPKGHTIHGNLTVQSGQVDVEGEVTGNLIVIDGEVNMASTARIAGQIHEVDQALEYIWYRVDEWVSDLVR